MNFNGSILPQMAISLHGFCQDEIGSYVFFIKSYYAQKLLVLGGYFFPQCKWALGATQKYGCLSMTEDPIMHH